MSTGMLPWLEMVADEHRVEPDLLGQAGKIQEFARSELFGRRLVSELQQRLLLCIRFTTETQRTQKALALSSRRRPGPRHPVDPGLRRYGEVECASTMFLCAKPLHLCQHTLPEAPHIREHRVDGSAFKIEIDVAD